ncbi:hypothetical protein J6590_072627 [Homalodisca vitripennis]|nr:hypothetical protein J6590_072627 [Homalodisca vitripennis]
MAKAVLKIEKVPGKNICHSKNTEHLVFIAGLKTLQRIVGVKSLNLSEFKFNYYTLRIHKQRNNIHDLVFEVVEHDHCSLLSAEAYERSNNKQVQASARVQAPRRVWVSPKNALKEELDSMVQQGIIVEEPRYIEWTSNISIIHKNDKIGILL